MTANTITSTALGQSLAKAKQTALKGPLFITTRGQPSHVLLTMEHYEKISKGKRNLIEILSDAPDYGVADIDFDPPRIDDLPRDIDLS